jgi:hypothetical protein
MEELGAQFMSLWMKGFFPRCCHLGLKPFCYTLFYAHPYEHNPCTVASDRLEAAPHLYYSWLAVHAEHGSSCPDTSLLAAAFAVGLLSRVSRVMPGRTSCRCLCLAVTCWCACYPSQSPPGVSVLDSDR